MPFSPSYLCSIPPQSSQRYLYLCHNHVNMINLPTQLIFSKKIDESPLFYRSQILGFSSMCSFSLEPTDKIIWSSYYPVGQLGGGGTIRECGWSEESQVSHLDASNTSSSSWQRFKIRSKASDTSKGCSNRITLSITTAAIINLASFLKGSIAVLVFKQG